MRILGADLDTNRRRTSVKWKAYGPTVLPLWVAEMDAQLAAPIVAAVEDLVRRGDTGYLWPQPYLDAFTAFAEELWGWQVDPGSMRVTADVMVGVEELTRILLPSTGRVVIDDPVYDAFPMHIAAVRRDVVRAPLGADGRLDLDVLEAVFEVATRDGVACVYWLCNPHNPTGTVPTRDELVLLAEVARRYGVRVISDEIHAPLCVDHTAFVPYLSVDPRGFTATSASKSFSLAGLKAGLVIAGDEAREDLAVLHPVVSFAASHVAVHAHTAAYTQGLPWLAQVRQEIAENRTLLRGALSERLPGIEWRDPAATYLAWLDVSSLGLGPQPARALLERAGVALSEGTNYGPAGSGFVRLNLATSPQIITEAVDRMVRCVGEGG